LLLVALLRIPLLVAWCVSWLLIALLRVTLSRIPLLTISLLAITLLSIVRTEASEPVIQSSRPLGRLYETSDKTSTVPKGLPSR